MVSELETTSKALLHNLQNLTVEGPGAPDEEAVLRAVKLKVIKLTLRRGSSQDPNPAHHMMSCNYSF